MPKCYSKQEREYIQNRLKEEAARCLSQYGIRRTTVDELVKRVKIPKGTFYLFYPSKELLLFEVILEQHEMVEQKLYQSICGMDPGDSLTDQLVDILMDFYRMAAEMPVLKLLDSDEIELLARKLPQDVLAEHLSHDNGMMEKVFSSLPVKPGVDPEVFSTAFRSLYFSSLHKDEIGEENFYESLRILLYGLISQLL